MLVKSVEMFTLTEFLRSTDFIDCEDYVDELPQTNLKEFPESESSGSKISYTKDSPSRHDGFVSTLPN